MSASRRAFSMGPEFVLCTSFSRLIRSSKDTYLTTSEAACSDENPTTTGVSDHTRLRKRRNSQTETRDGFNDSTLTLPWHQPARRREVANKDRDFSPFPLIVHRVGVFKKIGLPEHAVRAHQLRGRVSATPRQFSPGHGRSSKFSDSRTARQASCR